MPHQVCITARAERDVDEVLTLLADRAPQAGARWHTALLEKFQTLEHHPERCSLAHEADWLGIEVRELLFGKRRNAFRILFTIDGDDVNVHPVRRAARDWLQPGEW